MVSAYLVFTVVGAYIIGRLPRLWFASNGAAFAVTTRVAVDRRLGTWLSVHILRVVFVMPMLVGVPSHDNARNVYRYTHWLTFPIVQQCLPLLCGFHC